MKLNDYFNEIGETRKEENLISLSDNNYTYKGLNVLALISAKTKCFNKSFKKFNSFKNAQDLLNCNNDLKFLTANLFLLRPLINNPISESTIYYGQFLSTYFQNPADWIYSIYVSCCYEKLYNFWDRIGDALAYHLNLKIREPEVNFSKVIGLINDSKMLQDNVHFDKLLDFKNKKFPELNAHRKDIVHYYQFETTYRFEHAINCGDQEKISALWEWKRSMPEYFKENLILSCEGYYNTYQIFNNYS